jgi:hypothetical protein
MTRTKKEGAPAAPKPPERKPRPPLPQEGGRYLRQADGSLVKEQKPAAETAGAGAVKGD